MWLFGFATDANAESVIILDARDTTLIEDVTGSIGNGAGPHFTVGRTGQPVGSIRRGLLWFDIASAIPAGATIDSVTLQLNVSQVPPGSTSRIIELRPAIADWGEGASNAGSPGGLGAAAQSGDATWVHRFFDTDVWAMPGGDFAASTSATAAVDQPGTYTWGPAPALADDVQNWLDNPAGNFGWGLVGDETAVRTVKRFDSIQNPDPTKRPILMVEFTVADEACCLGNGNCVAAAPDDCSGMLGGTPLGPGAACADATTCCQPAGACDDGDACTTDTCSANQCIHMPVAGCQSCVGEADCHDNNECTDDLCSAGQCVNLFNTALCDDGNACTQDDHCTASFCVGAAIPNCCRTDDDCDDAEDCTEDLCTNDLCEHTAIDNCLSCEMDSDCSDGNVCTDDACVEGVCQRTDNTVPCDDGDVCTEGDKCVAGVCVATAIDACCLSDEACDDDNACTVESCDDMVCRHESISGCQACENDQDCVDENPCTDDECAAGRCEHIENDDTCDDGDPCTDAACIDGECVGEPIGGCCVLESDCDDGDLCTVDECSEQVCMNNPISGCAETPEDNTPGAEDDEDEPGMMVPVNEDGNGSDMDEMGVDGGVGRAPCGLFGAINLLMLFMLLSIAWVSRRFGGSLRA